MNKRQEVLSEESLELIENSRKYQLHHITYAQHLRNRFDIIAKYDGLREAEKENSRKHLTELKIEL